MTKFVRKTLRLREEMVKKARTKARLRHPLVKIAKRWRTPFKRGDRVTLTQRGRRTELVVNRVLAGAP